MRIAEVVLCECALSTFVDQPGALRGMYRVLLRVNRNLVGWIAASASGLGSALPFDVRSARATLREAERAVTDGSICHGVVIGQRAM